MTAEVQQPKHICNEHENANHATKQYQPTVMESKTTPEKKFLQS
jgi:hypothetical protein